MRMLISEHPANDQSGLGSILVRYSTAQLFWRYLDAVVRVSTVNVSLQMWPNSLDNIGTCVTDSLAEPSFGCVLLHSEEQHQQYTAQGKNSVDVRLHLDTVNHHCWHGSSSTFHFTLVGPSPVHHHSPVHYQTPLFMVIKCSASNSIIKHHH